MKQPPDWTKYSDRELQEAAATNAFESARLLNEIQKILVFMGIVAAIAAAKYLGFF